jgi:hypothetical protein
MLRAIATAAALAIAIPAYAGTYTVDPNGGADFDSLQAAIDAVPEGSTLLATGTFTEPAITIRKSIRILGTGLELMPWQFLDVALDVADADWVILEGVNVRRAGIEPFGAHGIHVSNVGHFALRDSYVEACFYDPFVWGSCLDPVPSGYHAVWLENVEDAWIERCELRGATGTHHFAFGDDGFCGEERVIGGRGGDGLRIDGSFVFLAGSMVIGGYGGTADWNDSIGRGEPPEMLVGGDGGNGVTGDLWFGGGGVLAYGEPGTWVYSAGPDWGIGHDGKFGESLTGTETPAHLPDALSVSALHVGEVATLSGQGFTPAGMVLLFVALELDPPIRIRAGQWLLEPPFVYLGPVATDGAGAFTLDAMLPDDPELVGALAFVQAFDVTQLSEPEELLFEE